MTNESDNLFRPHDNSLLQISTTRRRLLQLGGFAGAGFALSLAGCNSGKPQMKIFEFQTVTVNVKGEVINRRQGQAKGFTENISNEVGLDMIEIPKGSFAMGASKTEIGGGNDLQTEQRIVDMPTYFIGKYTITQEQWLAMMGNNPSNFKGVRLPVENVSWDNAMEFCDKLSKKTGKKYRLPSEPEWEYACRAGTTTPFAFGETITPDLANYDGNTAYDGKYRNGSPGTTGIFRQQTTVVGNFLPNGFGLYDMHGNVWEWCSSNYWSPDDYLPPIRGGDYESPAIGVRSAWRTAYSPRTKSKHFGFRIALTLE